MCVYVLACRQESLRNDSGSEREAVGCVFGRTTENSEIIVHYGIFSIIDRTSYRGQNYRINTIIIVHLATLVGINFNGALLPPTVLKSVPELR